MGETIIPGRRRPIIINRYEGVLAYCQKRTSRGDRIYLRAMWVPMTRCQMWSKHYDDYLYSDCYGCTMWHKYIPKPKKRKIIVIKRKKILKERK